MIPIPFPTNENARRLLDALYVDEPDQSAESPAPAVDDFGYTLGDHLVTPRTVYTHHGIYIGNGRVMHYAGWADGLGSGGNIETISLAGFAAGESIRIEAHLFEIFSREDAVARAWSRIGEDRYSVAFNNCEHFVMWCIMGIHWSHQCMTPLIAAGPHMASMYQVTTLATALPGNQTAVQLASHFFARTATQGAVNGLLATTANYAVPVAWGAAKKVLPYAAGAYIAYKVITEYDDVIIDAAHATHRAVGEAADFVSDAAASACDAVGDGVRRVGEFASDLWWGIKNF